MDNERSQFTFYASFAKAAERIKKKTDRCDFYDIVKDYAIYGKAPDLEKIADSVAIAFELIKPNLDTSKRKSNGGKAKNKQARQAEDSGKEKEKEIEIESELENECSLSPSPLSAFHSPSFDEVCEFNRLRGSLIDAKPFFEYYAAADWRDSEGKPVRNWQQKFITWELRELNKRKGARNGLEQHNDGDAGKKWDVPGTLYL